MPSPLQNHLIFGNQELLLREKRDELVKGLCKEGETEFLKFNAGLFTGTETQEAKDAYAEFVGVLQSHSLFAQDRLVLLEEVELLKVAAGKAQSQKSQGGKLLVALLEFLKNPMPDVRFILVANVRKLTELSSPLAKLVQSGTAVNVHNTLITYDDFDPTQWILERCRKMKLNLTPSAVDLLISLAGNDLMVIQGELVKIRLYAGNEQESIDEGKLSKIVSHSKSFGPFRITKLMSEKNLPDSMECLEYLFRFKNDEVYSLLAMLTFHFRQMLKISWMLDNGYPQKDIQAQLKINPGMLRRKIEETQKYETRELENIFIHLCRLDTELKLAGKEAPALLKNFCFLVLKNYFKNQTGIKKQLWI